VTPVTATLKLKATGSQSHLQAIARYDFFRPGFGWGYGYSPYSRRRLSRLRRADSEDTFNAREVIENLGPKLIHPEIKA